MFGDDNHWSLFNHFGCNKANIIAVDDGTNFWLELQHRSILPQTSNDTRIGCRLGVGVKE